MATDDDAPDPARMVKLARQALSSAEFRKRFNLLDFWGPAELYPPQLEFFAKGVSHRQRLIRGGNQVGKSFACALEVALHLSGKYFSWWRGRKFTKPIRCWVVGPSLQSVRDGAQKQLTAKQGEFGTGTIPLTAFVGKPVMIPGGTGGIDTLSVAHQAGGVSTLTFKSFEQGIAKLQSESVDLIWIDERCGEDVYAELLARTIATDGSILISYTPLKGGGELTYRFLNEPDPDRCDIRIDENDALHIPVERRERIERNLPEHERDARIRGIPTLGIARVFPYPLAQLMQKINPDGLPDWARRIVGIDFGINHPCAGALCAWTHDTEQFWVLDTFRASNLSLAEQARRIYDMCRGTRIPVAYPHDAMTREKGSGETLALQLKAYACRC